jgi:glyoxylase I family protein
VVYQSPQGTLFGLWPVSSTKFDSEHTGLDHVSFAVNRHGDLKRAAAARHNTGLEHGEVRDLADAGSRSCRSRIRLTSA